MKEHLKTGVKGGALVLAGLVAGSNLHPDNRPSPKEVFGPYEYTESRNGTDGSNLNNVDLVSVSESYSGGVKVITIKKIPKSCVNMDKK